MRLIIESEEDLEKLPKKPVIRFCYEKVTSESYLARGEIPENADSFFTVWQCENLIVDSKVLGKAIINLTRLPMELIVCESLTSKTFQKISKLLNVRED